MRILPKTRWQLIRLLLVIAVSFAFVSPRWWLTQGRAVRAFLITNRVRDQAGVLSLRDQWHFERFLQQIDDESGVDIRFLLVPSVNEDLVAFGVRQARAMGMGRDTDRRGLLFVYDVAQHRLRIEVGPQMEPVITDAFAGYLMREHVRSFFGTGNPSLGLRTTLFMVQHRLREAVLGRDYDPRVLQFIADSRRLAMGGGASADMRADPAGAFLNQARTSRHAIRTYFAPQPSPEAAFQRYLDWLARGNYATDVPLFTPLSQEYMATLTMTRGFNKHVLMMEYGQPYRVDQRGDLALLYFTTDPLLWPHFLRRTPQGWVIDMWAEVLNVRNYSGWWYTWALLDNGDDFATAFADRYAEYGGPLRVRGGDNRPLPVRAYPEIKLQPPPDPGDSLTHITVEEAATRIANTGRSLVVLYSTWSQYERAAMPLIASVAEGCRKAGWAVLAFNTDQEPRALWDLPGVLRQNKAPFAALNLTRWQPGRLSGGMAPLGIKVGAQWDAPILAVRDGTAGVLLQTEGVEGLVAGAPGLLAVCQKARHKPL
jgi:uncharacterized protein